MTYTLTLRSDEPCDVYVVVRDGNLLAMVAESQTVYACKLGELMVPDFTTICRKHEFTHRSLEVTVVDDLALVDGSACYRVDLNARSEEVIRGELSGC